MPGAVDTKLAYQYQRFAAVELVGKDDVVASPNWTKSAQLVTAWAENISGYILSVSLVSYTSASGGVLKPTGDIIFFNADPAIVKNTVNLTANGVLHKTMIGRAKILDSHWQDDTGGAFAFPEDFNPVAFEELGAIWAAMRFDNTTLEYNTTPGNDANDELLELSCAYARS